MAANDDRIVIVGASLAGGNAALSLREHGHTGPIVLLGAEDVPPYERPPLSKALMQGKQDQPDWVLGDGAAQTWVDRNIELRTGTRAERIDAAAHTVALVGGDSVDYDRLVLATGAGPTRPDGLPGTELDGVRTLRTWADATAIKDAAQGAGRVVIIGSSWIGCEVAASLRQVGCDVELLDVADHLLPKLGSKQVGDRIAGIHREHGVHVHSGLTIRQLAGTSSVSGVVCDGSRFDAEVVVLATGVAPDLTLARSAGLAEASNGVAVDATFATSDPAIWAIGDLAALDHPLYGTHARVEHWDVAKEHGRQLGAVLTGEAGPFTRPPLFFSDQYDLGFEYRGWIDPAGPTPQVVVRGEDPDGPWYAFWLVDGALHAVLNANAWDDADALWQLAADQPHIAPERLADPAVAITDLV